MTAQEEAERYRRALQTIIDLEAAGYTLAEIGVRALRTAKDELKK